MMEALTRALDTLAAEGKTARFWLRDDDATEPTPALDRLLALGLPVTLAVIPEPTGEALAARLSGTQTEVATHGWAHANHAGLGEKKWELGLHRPLAVVLAELAEGLAKLRALHGPRALPLLVPPWNRIAPAVVAGLPGIGFQALSVYGPENAGVPLRINAHVDIINWRGNRRTKDNAQLEADILARLTTGHPVGILTHHLAHRRDAWAFLDRLARATDHPACRWVSAADLMSPGLPGQ